MFSLVAVYYSNRAQCHLKLKDYEAALEDWLWAKVCALMQNTVYANTIGGRDSLYVV